MSVPYIFLRDDDVWSDDEIFLELSCFLKKLRLPVIYGIIPSRLEPRLRDILKRAKIHDPDLLDIVQHGFQHVNVAPPGKSKYEFGAGRSFCQQYKDIGDGLKIMQRSFGSSFTPAFMPPYHGFDVATLQVVEKLGFKVFSAGKKAVLSGKSFCDLPARVALNQYRPDGVSLAFDSRMMVARCRREMRCGMIGLVYHHRAIKDAADMRAIKLFFRFLAQAQERRDVRLFLFSQWIRWKEGHEKISA